MEKQWKQWQTIFLGSKITADGDCSHESKTLAHWKKSYDQPRHSLLRSRGITLPTKVCLVKAMVFPVVMYGWNLDHKEGRALKNWCFWTVVSESVPWTSRRSNQSILKEISPEYSFEGLMLKLKLPIFWPPDAKNWLTGKDPDVGKDWRRRMVG